VFFAVACVTNAHATLTRQEVESLFSQGNQFFRTGLEKAKADKAASEAAFRDAAAAWRAIAVDGNIHNAKLEGNIANASLLAGDVPRAIAAFRRAQALDPFDPAFRGGLSAARRTIGTESLSGTSPLTDSKEDSSGGLSGTWRSITTFLSYAAKQTLLYLPERILLLAGGVLYVGAFTLATLRFAGRRSIRPWWAPAALVACILAVGPLVAREWYSPQEGVIVAANIVARNGPAELYDPAFKEPLTPGIELRVDEQRQGWLHVRLHDGRTAWVPAQSVERI
jgi:hypothetical protein